MKLRFCTECAAPLHKKTQTEYVCDNGHKYWNNTRLCGTAVLIKNGEILFSKRAVEPKKGMYDLPGGFTEFSEGAYDAAKRELKEETSIDALEMKLVYCSPGEEVLENSAAADVVFIATTWHGTPQAADDVAELEWKSIDFIDSPQFAWKYPGLTDILKQYIT